MKIASHELKAIIDYCIDKGKEIENETVALNRIIVDKQRDIQELQEIIRRTSAVPIAPIAHVGDSNANY